MGKRGENIYKRKDGRWEGRYIKKRKVDGSIQFGYIYGKKYLEVREKLLEMKLVYQQYYNNQVSFQRTTLTQWSEIWLNQQKKYIKQSTWVSYRSKLSLHVWPSIGAYKLYLLTTDDLNNWSNDLLKELNPNSTRAVIRVLCTCLEKAVKTGIIAKNPCKDIILPKLTSPTIRALTKEEQKKLQTCAWNSNNGLPVNLALETGLRIGEISGLKWEDIDFSICFLTVNRTLQRLPQLDTNTRRKTSLVELTPKTVAAQRMIPLSPRIIELFEIKKSQSTGPYVFGGEKPCEPRLLTYWFKDICVQAGISDIRFHSLRHTFATRCLERGISIGTISALLGHSSIKMTLDTYISTSLDEKRKAIKLISSSKAVEIDKRD